MGHPRCQALHVGPRGWSRGQGWQDFHSQGSTQDKILSLVEQRGQRVATEFPQSPPVSVKVQVTWFGATLKQTPRQGFWERQVVEMGVTPVWAEEEQRRKEIQKHFVNEEVRAWAMKAQ